ncbi:hypothetical protein VNO77_36010 [Canavalia gladiata]|uniref:Uncharacterized protein n=1 Tax=Canavalia gladiata TaxID=3824 RepID=A0AAN9PU35_CANGL
MDPRAGHHPHEPYWAVLVQLQPKGQDPSESHGMHALLAYMVLYEVAFLCPITVKGRAKRYLNLKVKFRFSKAVAPWTLYNGLEYVSL